MSSSYQLTNHLHYALFNLCHTPNSILPCLINAIHQVTFWFTIHKFDGVGLGLSQNTLLPKWLFTIIFFSKQVHGK
jgi:hypothetical protein